MASQSNISVETDHLTTSASRYDSVSTTVDNLLRAFLQLEGDLATACGNDETGQKIHSQIESIKRVLVRDTQLFAEVTELTGDGIRDMRDAYEQAENDAELIASGVDSQNQLGSNDPSQNNGGGNSNTENPGNRRRR